MNYKINCEVQGYIDIQFEVGQQWKTRGGEVVEITAVYNDSNLSYPIESKGITYARNGREYSHIQKDTDLVELVSGPAKVSYEDEHAQDVAPPEPEHIFSQDLSEPYDYETDEESIVDNTIHLHEQPVINHNGEYYIKQAINIYVDSDDLDRARILIKALKHIKEI